MKPLKQHGYEYYDLADILHDSYSEADLAALTAAFDDLPADDYAPDLNRYRQYGRAVIFPGTHRIEWLPETVKNGKSYYDYFQGSFNPEYPDASRRFPAIPAHVRSNRLLEALIAFNFRQTFWTREDALMPFHAGVHFVKLHVESEQDEAFSSPNTLHQDGEPFTFAHLIRRRNIEGARNVISVPEVRGRMPEDVAREKITDSFYMTRPLESYGVYDPLVTHYVGSVRKGAEDGPGERSAILIDYQPTVVANPDEIRSMHGDTDNMDYV